MPTDLSTLASIPGAGGAAAFMAGQMQPGNLQEQDLGNQRLQQLVQQLQIGNQQSTAMNPLLLAHQGLENQGLQAGLPGITADSNLKTTNASNAARTSDSDVMAKIANNHSQVIKDNAEDIHNSAIALGKLAITMGQNGQDTGPGTLINAYQAAKDSGADLSNPFIKSALDHVAHLPVDAAAQALQDMAARAIKLSEPYMQSTDTEAGRAASAERVANIGAAGSLAVENARAASNEKIASLRAQQVQSVETQLSKIHDPVARQSFLTDQYSKAVTAGNNELANMLYSRMQLNMPIAQAVLNKQTQGGVSAAGMLNNNTIAPATTALTLPPTAAGGAQPPANAASAAPDTEAAIPTAAKAAWGSYEPNKYMYRMINGKLQRAPITQSIPQ